MSKYLIRAYPKRMWFVTDYIIPSLLAQGIPMGDITVYNDEKGEGNLRSFLNVCYQAPNDGGGTWYIQDDVCICRDFKRFTELYDDGFVCGFSSERYDGKGRIGAVHVKDMWFSFPCIRIPNKVARECAEWVDKYIIGNWAYKQFWESGRNDDWAFRTFVFQRYDKCLATNLAPNLVDHVDYLLGGGSGGKRPVEVRAQYFYDLDLVQDLEEKILKNQKKPT